MDNYTQLYNLIIYGACYTIAFILSLWMGNFLTSFFYRIPRGITMNGRRLPPMCSNCKTRLYYPDYGPIYYYFFKNKFCKGCGSGIPAVYYVIEILASAILVCNFIFNGIDNLSVISTFFLSTVILCLFINYYHEQTYYVSNILILFCGLIRVFTYSSSNHFLDDIIMNTACGLIASLFLGKIYHKNHRFSMIAISIGIHYNQFIIIFAISCVIYLIGLALIHFEKNTQIKNNIARHTNLLTVLCVVCIVKLVFFSFEIDQIILFKENPFTYTMNQNMYY